MCLYITAIEDSLSNTIKKMQQKEQENMERIEALEARLKQRMTSHVADEMQSRLRALEEKMTQGFHAKLNKEVRNS